jgi:hypothetical protein
MFSLLKLGANLTRYWRMTHDPRTPLPVKALVYSGIAVALWPKAWQPRWLKGQSLFEDTALAPGLISLGLLMIPKEVEDDHPEPPDQPELPTPMVGQWTTPTRTDSPQTPAA